MLISPKTGGFSKNKFTKLYPNGMMKILTDKYVQSGHKRMGQCIYESMHLVRN